MSHLQSTWKHSNIFQIENTPKSLMNPSKDKILKTCIKRSQSKGNYRSPLKLQRSTNTNIKSVTIDITNSTISKKTTSKDLLEKCKLELNHQNRLLIKQIQKKEEKIEKLRDTFRKIQKSHSKEITDKSAEKIKPKITLQGKKYRQTPQTVGFSQSQQSNIHSLSEKAKAISLFGVRS